MFVARTSRALAWVGVLLACGDSETGNGGSGGGNSCQQAEDAIRSRYEECGVVTGADPIEECTVEGAANLECTTACIVGATCGALKGTDQEALQAMGECFAQCPSASSGGGGAGGGTVDPNGGAPSNGGGPSGGAPSGGGPSGGGGPTFDSCAQIDQCLPTDETDLVPTESCVACAVAGDTSVAPDGGICEDYYLACFGSNGDCSDGSPECCGFLECFNGCDLNGNGQISSGAELDCVCTNDGSSCIGGDSGTCLGDYPRGVEAFLNYDGCVYGNGNTPGACYFVCE